MNNVKMEVFTSLRGELRMNGSIVNNGSWYFIRSRTWDTIEDCLGIEHMYYADVEGWIVEVK